MAVEYGRTERVTTAVDLVVGEANSGKSAWAEETTLARAGAEPPLYVATLPPIRCFADRILRHRERRGQRWNVIEVERRLAEALQAPPANAVLIDGLIAYVNRRLTAAYAAGQGAFASTTLLAECLDVITALQRRSAYLCVVTTVACRDQMDGATRADRESIAASLRIGGELVRRGARAWWSRDGMIARVEWSTCLTSFGWTTI